MFHMKAQEVFWPIESALDLPSIANQQSQQQQEQTIVYAASIRKVLCNTYLQR
jgi:hypothetical protein